MPRFFLFIAQIPLGFHNADSDEDSVFRKYVITKQKIKMKRIYVFVRVVGKFSPNDVVYHVRVGESSRDCTLIALIKEYCRDCGLYLKERGRDTDIMTDNLAKGVFRDAMIPRLHLRFVSIPVSECYRRIIDDDWSDIEASNVRSKSFLHVLTRTSDNVYSPSRWPKAKKVPAFRARKNLSPLLEEESAMVALSFAIIAFLFLFVGYLDGLQLCQ